VKNQKERKTRKGQRGLESLLVGVWGRACWEWGGGVDLLEILSSLSPMDLPGLINGIGRRGKRKVFEKSLIFTQSTNAGEIIQEL